MQFFTTIVEIEFIAMSITMVQKLNKLCWVTEISQRQVAFVAIMRPPRPNLKIKHEINYGIESFYSRGAGKLKLCLVQICYIITLKTNIM